MAVPIDASAESVDDLLISEGAVGVFKTEIAAGDAKRRKEPRPAC